MPTSWSKRSSTNSIWEQRSSTAFSDLQTVAGDDIQTSSGDVIRLLVTEAISTERSGRGTTSFAILQNVL